MAGRAADILNINWISACLRSRFPTYLFLKAHD